jgi:predicted nucleic acid-binding protein
LSTPFVLDTSIAISWCFEDEITEQTDAILATLESTYAEVPALFLFELQNVFRIGERRGRVTAARIQSFWERLLLLDLRIEPMDSLTGGPILLDLARQYGLTAYDAAYLDLAQRKKLRLATLDGALRAAAIVCGVVLLP